MEPTYEQQANVIIPAEVANADIIGGDLNQAHTTYKKIANVYHVNETLSISSMIKVPRKVSDHPIILATAIVPFEQKRNNMNKMLQLIGNTNIVPNLIDPKLTKIIKENNPDSRRYRRRL